VVEKRREGAAGERDHSSPSVVTACYISAKPQAAEHADQDVLVALVVACIAEDVVHVAEDVVV